MDKNDKTTPADNVQIDLTNIPTDEGADAAAQEATSEQEAEQANITKEDEDILSSLPCLNTSSLKLLSPWNL